MGSPPNQVFHVRGFLCPISVLTELELSTDITMVLR
jgi:hypothetical protein